MNAKMSKNFDKRLLNSMVGKQIPVDSFEEELKKFHPSLEVEDAEEAIYNQDLTDAADLLVKMIKESEEKEEK